MSKKSTLRIFLAKKNLIPFTKRFESSENLVNLLESRGLQICDRNKAIQYLDNIGYYRLSAYMYPLLKMPKTAHFYKKYDRG